MSFVFIHQLGTAAVVPNGQPGRCGPYYFWYQVSPDNRTYSADYIDLCGITFDITDVLDDFDFVNFTDTSTLQRASLDRNRDGISDLYFFGRNQNKLEWKPDNDCIRINLRECQGTTFNENCGYAMISIQPKPGIRNGSARIPIRVTKKCPPYGADCSETATIFHDYYGCVTSAAPDFIVHKHVDPVLLYTTYVRPEFTYTVTVQNAGAEKGNTILTDTVTNGTNGGTLHLSTLKITTCPAYARCTVSSITHNTIQISLTGLLMNDKATITYILTGNRDEVAQGEVSYFTNTATLSNGSSSQVTVGIRGGGEFPSPPRPERPR